MQHKQHRSITLTAREVFFITNWSPRQGEAQAICLIVSAAEILQEVQGIYKAEIVCTLDKKLGAEVADACRKEKFVVRLSAELKIFLYDYKRVTPSLQE